MNTQHFVNLFDLLHLLQHFPTCPTFLHVSSTWSEKWNQKLPNNSYETSNALNHLPQYANEPC